MNVVRSAHRKHDGKLDTKLTLSTTTLKKWATQCDETSDDGVALRQHFIGPLAKPIIA